jgi:Fanconi anemia group J protein
MRLPTISEHASDIIMASLFQHQHPPQAHSEIKIAGYAVRFPAGKKPFPAQLGVMNTALKALHSSQNALIESPTGTGKTLALLASCLSWQREHYFRSRRQKKTMKKKRVVVALPVSSSSRLNGVGVSKGSSSASSASAGTTHNSTSGSRGALKRRIYFASRTHSQLSQVISEMKKCHSALEWKDHRPNAVVLASRRHYCINEKVSSLRPHSRQGNACRSLLEAHACSYAKRAPALTAKADRLCDIEDLVAAGREHGACPYYASQDMAEAPTSSIVLCPYNYLIDPIIRRAMNIDVTNAIIVFDEGHNVAGLLREAASD